MKRVIMVEFKGAADRYSLHLARSISKSGIDLVLVSVENCIKEPDINYTLIKIFPNFSKYRSYLKKIYKYLIACAFVLITAIKKKTRIIHYQYVRLLEIDFLFILFLRLLRFKIIYTAHNVTPHESKKHHKLLLYWFYRLCNHIISSSTYSKRLLINDFNIDKIKITVIPIGYTGPLYMPDISKKDAKKLLNIQIQDKVLLCFGSIREYKGIDVLIRSMVKVKQNIGDFKLIIAGACWDKKLINQYLQLIKDLNIQDVIDMHIGFVDDSDLPNYFISSDIVVIPYKRMSGHSSIILLAYHYSRPVIASAVGGLVEEVIDSRTGYFVLPDNNKNLADVIVRALTNFDQLEKLGQCGKKFKEERFSWDLIGKETADIYNKIL